MYIVSCQRISFRGKAGRQCIWILLLNSKEHFFKARVKRKRRRESRRKFLCRKLFFIVLFRKMRWYTIFTHQLAIQNLRIKSKSNRIILYLVMRTNFKGKFKKSINNKNQSYYVHPKEMNWLKTWRCSYNIAIQHQKRS